MLELWVTDLASSTIALFELGVEVQVDCRRRKYGVAQLRHCFLRFVAPVG